MDLAHWLGRAVEQHEKWQDGHGPGPGHPALDVAEADLSAAFDALAERLGGSYPFFHPRYAGQMLKPPHPVAVTGYLAAMLVNPNNHARDGGPTSSALEEEVVEELAAMFGYGEHLGHLTSSGTLGNLEALFVARESHPGKGVAFSAESHYTHARMCHLLGIEAYTVPVDARGRMDVDALERLLSTGAVGTVVATMGTTGLGAVDPLHRILERTRPAGVRVHADAAYGGFFTLLAQPEQGPGQTPGRPPGRGTAAGRALVDPAPWRALPSCDSVVVDPHKHGLQPYGCGAVLFRDPEVRRFYGHDSPYTYFTSARPHLGEISLECSRSGAAAAALWLTLRLFPLTREGLGRVLAPGRRAALRWAGLIEASPRLDLYQPPDLDIVTYHRHGAPPVLSGVAAASEEMMREGMRDGDDAVFLSTSRVSAAAFTARRPDAVADAEETRILRSVLMKPEAEPYLDRLHARVEALAADSLGAATAGAAAGEARRG
ncbi:aminotransferase class I/II-fold pyridoxal phosphate-dependent enzyme [Streptomyces sp. NPDC047002]|uniref:pyridoxal phosphate-dependent decarboxylase family protein n=1 Tax=Streptomyces sp. NPDC047002 TaxID=3155475 RepID=UPI0034525A59